VARGRRFVVVVAVEWIFTAKPLTLYN